MIPLLVASLQSMLSTPVPARPMIFSFFPAAMTSEVTLVADRTMSPSWFWKMYKQILCMIKDDIVNDLITLRAGYETFKDNKLRFI